MSPTTLISLLQQRAGELPHQRGFTFLEDDGSERHLTYGELDRRARAIATALCEQARPGERALLLFAPGLEYIEALFGCLYAGVLAVPAYPPDVTRLQRTLPRLQAIAADSGASLLLTTQGIHMLAGELISEAAPDLARLRWVTTDALEENSGGAQRFDDVAPGTLAFLQYTSGSTGTPKGVMLSHTNLMHNCELIYRRLRARTGQPRGDLAAALPRHGAHRRHPPAALRCLPHGADVAAGLPARVPCAGCRLSASTAPPPAAAPTSPTISASGRRRRSSARRWT